MAIRSMTGFGRAERSTAAYVVVVEVRTVNQKGLDVKLRAPAACAAHEQRVHAVVRNHVARGRIDVAIDVTAGNMTRDAAVEERLRSAAALAGRLGVPGTFTPSDVLRALAHVPSHPDIAVDADVLAAVVDEAVVACVAARADEGARVAAVLERELSLIAATASRIRAWAAARPALQRDRLHAKVAALGVDVEPARLAQEIALLVERGDVTEELDRLDMHVERFRQIVADDKHPGRALDFLCQELLREANTCASKVQDADVAHAIVDVKVAVERLREQVQNVE